MHNRYEIVSDRHRLAAIEAAWTVLWQNTHSDLYLSHDWVSTWWDECHAGTSLRIGCAWRGSDLVAVLPLCIRKIKLLRVVEWAGQTFSDYCDVMVRDQRNLAVLEALWAAITQRGGFDLVRLKHIRANSPMFLLGPRLGLTEERVEFSLQVTGRWANGAAWFRTLNKKVRNNHTRGKRILSESGPIRFRPIAPGEPCGPVIQHLLALKRQWPGYRNSPMVRDDTTLVALALALERLGALRLFVLEQGGNIIAGTINAIQGSTMLALFATYDLAHDRAGPGIILMTEYTMWSFDNEITTIDYLLGAESYKFKFATQKTDLHIFVQPKTLRGRLVHALYSWKQRRAEPDVAITIGSAYLTSKGTPRATTQSPSESDC